MSDDACIRCGLCCTFYVNGIKHKCKHLIRLPNKKSLCRIYKTRLGTVLWDHGDGRKIICTMRNQSQFDYPGCPQNTGKPLYSPETNHSTQ